MTKVTYKEALALLDLEGLPSPDVVRRAFRREALKWHPDKVVATAAAAASNSGELTTLSAPDHSGSGGYGGTSTPRAGAGADTGACSPPPTAPPQPASPQPLTMSREEAEERFKRLAAAYHLLLKAADGAAMLQLKPPPASGHHAAGSTAATGAAAAAAPRASADAKQQQGAAGQGLDPDRDPDLDPSLDLDDEALADALSADLLLQAERRLRLSDFDRMFLHQRATVGAAGLSPEWSDAVRDVDDLWRRIRRRLERRRQKRQQAAAAQAGGRASGSGGGSGIGAGGGRPGATGGSGAASGGGTAPNSKWSLLFEFMADVVGAEGTGASQRSTHGGQGAEEEEEEGEEPQAHAGVAYGSSTGSRGGANECVGPSAQVVACGGGGGGGEAQGTAGVGKAGGPRLRGQVGTGDAGAAARAAATGDSLQERRHGRLPPGFYWRWVRRLLALQLLVGVLFKR